MICPIQQNVVFKGADKIKGADNFKGNIQVARSVRGDYNSTINTVLNIQQSTKSQVDKACGKKINTIA